MGTKINSNYSDLLTFTRASKGHALRPVSYGAELVTNGDFSTDSDWTKQSGWSISGGVAVSNNASGYNDIRQSLSLTASKLYRIDFSVSSYTSGAVKPYLGNSGAGDADVFSGNLGDAKAASAAGNYYGYFVFPAGQHEQILLRAQNGFVGSIDNISVKEVTFDQTDGTLTLFEHPNNVPRVEWDADRNRLGLLVEEARTNLVTYSEDFSQWNGSSDPNEIIAPDGTLTATKIRDNNQGSNATVTLVEPVTVSTSTTHTYSVFGKKGQLNWMALGVIAFTTPSNARVWFDLDNGVVGTQGPSLSGAIEEFPNGWYRCSVTFTTDASDTSGQLYIYVCENDGEFLNTARDGTSDLYIWGAQLEAGSFPTSYIKTTGATATRSADVASIPVADFGYNTAVGSVVAEYTPTKVNGDVRGVFEIAASTTSNRAYHSASEGNHWLVRSEGATPAAIDIGTVSENANKVAAVYKKDDFAVSVNGASVGTDTSGNVPISIIEMNIGALQNGFHLNGHIKSIQYYPRRLTNAQLQDLTS